MEIVVFLIDVLAGVFCFAFDVLMVRSMLPAPRRGGLLLDRPIPGKEKP